jgi:uncharacterized protein YecE (DUF72 family)
MSSAPSAGDRSGAPPHIGCAGWTIPRDEATRFPETGSHLERYAARFTAVEINSSFYRPHRRTTYVRWGETVPEGFRFSVKVPKSITHERRLRDVDALLDPFLEETSGLGAKLGCYLVQLPPSFVFELDDVGAFFETLRERTTATIACEPRHRSWSAPLVDELLESLRVARVMADPVRVPGAEDPGGWTGAVYYRLHGSPRVYWSSYDDEYLDAMAHRIEEDLSEDRDVWCIFDNTARSAATTNGLWLLDRLAAGARP